MDLIEFLTKNNIKTKKENIVETFQFLTSEEDVHNVRDEKINFSKFIATGSRLKVEQEYLIGSCITIRIAQKPIIESLNQNNIQTIDDVQLPISMDSWSLMCKINKIFKTTKSTTNMNNNNNEEEIFLDVTPYIKPIDTSFSFCEQTWLGKRELFESPTNCLFSVSSLLILEFHSVKVNAFSEIIKELPSNLQNKQGWYYFRKDTPTPFIPVSSTNKNNNTNDNHVNNSFNISQQQQQQQSSSMMILSFDEDDLAETEIPSTNRKRLTKSPRKEESSLHANSNTNNKSTQQPPIQSQSIRTNAKLLDLNDENEDGSFLIQTINNNNQMNKQNGSSKQASSKNDENEEDEIPLKLKNGKQKDEEMLDQQQNDDDELILSMVVIPSQQQQPTTTNTTTKNVKRQQIEEIRQHHQASKQKEETQPQPKAQQQTTPQKQAKTNSDKQTSGKLYTSSTYSSRSDPFLNEEKSEPSSEPSNLVVTSLPAAQIQQMLSMEQKTIQTQQKPKTPSKIAPSFVDLSQSQQQQQQSQPQPTNPKSKKSKQQQQPSSRKMIPVTDTPEDIESSDDSDYSGGKKKKIGKTKPFGKIITSTSSTTTTAMNNNNIPNNNVVSLLDKDGDEIVGKKRKRTVTNENDLDSNINSSNNKKRTKQSQSNSMKLEITGSSHPIDVGSKELENFKKSNIMETRNDDYDKMDENPSQDQDLDGFVVNDAEPLETYHSPSSQLYESSGGSLADSQTSKQQKQFSSTKQSSGKKSSSSKPTFEDEEQSKSLDENQQISITSNLWSSHTDKDAFEIYLQFMVSAVLDPQFVSSVEQAPEVASYFLPPVKKIESKVNDLKRFLLRSSVWKEHVSSPLESFPYYSKQKLAVTDAVLCQVCERKNHPSKYIISLSGDPYDSELLWGNTIMLDDPAHDAFREDFNKNEYPKLWCAGQYCAARLTIFHNLHHYKYRLVDSIQKQLKAFNFSDDVEAPEKLNSLMDHKFWVDEKFVEWKNLLEQAEQFRKKKIEENDEVVLKA